MHALHERPQGPRIPSPRILLHHNIPVVILCGGLGTMLREETEFKPKPMVEIGGKPVLWLAPENRVVINEYLVY